MRRLKALLLSAVLATTLAGAGALSAQQGAAATKLKWGPAPPFLPAGAKIAVVEGDPGGTGPFTIHLLLPAGWRIGPHMHPSDEAVTVVRGSVSYGMGDTFDVAKMKRAAVGASVTLPANENHYVRARARTEIEIKSTAPFQITYVNPKDDPRNKKGGKSKG